MLSEQAKYSLNTSEYWIFSEYFCNQNFKHSTAFFVEWLNARRENMPPLCMFYVLSTFWKCHLSFAQISLFVKPKKELNLLLSVLLRILEPF